MSVLFRPNIANSGDELTKAELVEDAEGSMEGDSEEEGDESTESELGDDEAYSKTFCVVQSKTHAIESNGNFL